MSTHGEKLKFWGAIYLTKDKYLLWNEITIQGT